MLEMPQYVAYVCFVFSLFLEYIIYLNATTWNFKKILASTSMIVGSFAAGVLVFLLPSVLSILIFFVAIYRSINSLRLVQNRMHEKHLRKVTLKSLIILSLFEMLLIIAFVLRDGLPDIEYQNILTLYLGICLLVVAIVFIKTLYNIQHTRIKKVRNLKSNIPTVSLAIPARNEDYALDECLEAALASDYPKLEILVIDDCSQDKTPQIIKEYAHRGVRFIQASETGTSWLPKNKAYQTLYEQASGQIIMFMGVDVSLSPETISKLMAIFINRKCKMLSVMPSRVKSGLVAALVQPMRYWHELALPQTISRRPPVLSTCWLIDKKTLSNIGEFKSVARTINPEEHFAKNLQKEYLFIRNSKSIGIFTEKDFFSQWDTAERTHYPQFHKRPELIMLATMMELTFLIGPYITLFYLLIFNYSSAVNTILALLSCVALSLSHMAINFVTNRQAFWLSVINFPFVVATDIVAMQTSMYSYEFGEVIWKGRNITGPTMHVYSNLPKIR